MAVLGKAEKYIVEALAQSNFILTVHAERNRMPDRHVRRADIVGCGRTAKKCIYDTKRDTYKVIGLDLDGETLNVIAGIDNGVVIITVY